MNRSHRLLALTLLILVATALCIHYGGAYEQNWPHPTGEQLAEDPDGWDGEAVLLFGTVTDQTDDGFVIEVSTESGEIASVVEVHGSETTVTSGGVVQVYGELSEQGTVQHAESIVVVNDDTRAGQYKLAVSVLGVLLAAGAFLWYWRIEWGQIRFAVRQSGGENNG